MYEPLLNYKTTHLCLMKPTIKQVFSISEWFIVYLDEETNYLFTAL